MRLDAGENVGASDMAHAMMATDPAIFVFGLWPLL
jgi:hypothetical protein